MKQTWRGKTGGKWLRNSASGLAIILTLATLLGFLGDWWWPLDLLDHLRPHYCYGLLLAGLGLALLRKWQALLLLIPLAINLSLLAPLINHQLKSRPDLSLTHASLDKDKVEALTAAIAQNSDLLLLQEVTPQLSQQIRVIPGYELILIETLSNTHGSALLVREGSEVEVNSAEVINLPDGATRPLISAALTINNQAIQLLSLHTTRARNRATSLGQSAEFVAVAEWSRKQQSQGKQTLIIGDFNTTPWSGRMRQLLKAGQLTNGMKHQGYQASWPAALPSFLQIPIDLVAHSDKLTVTSLSTGASAGSDHRPLHVGVALGS